MQNKDNNESDTKTKQKDIEELEAKKPRYNKFVWDEGNMPTLICNETIQCKDCKYVYDRIVIECDKYKVKPNYVLDKEKECPYYE